jgi:hypothetical protein
VAKKGCWDSEINVGERDFECASTIPICNGDNIVFWLFGVDSNCHVCV